MFSVFLAQSARKQAAQKAKRLNSAALLLGIVGATFMTCRCSGDKYHNIDIRVI